jgi:hypothetical protein
MEQKVLEDGINPVNPGIGFVVTGLGSCFLLAW